MILDSDIVFVTSSLNTKWIVYQSDIIKKLFPDSNHIIIDGSTKDFKQNWPSSWFYWIEEIKNRSEKYYIHIDEDFFITSKSELIKCVNKMESDNIDLLGCSDGYNYRSNNPIALNSFFMIGKVEQLSLFNFNGIVFRFDGNNWVNNFNIKYKEEYSINFEYKYDKYNVAKFNDFEPYYVFFWKAIDNGLKIDYLYPHFDTRFKSTNPRIDKESNDIGIHMWYTRNWNSDMLVSGVSNKDRYYLVEEYLKNKKEDE